MWVYWLIFFLIIGPSAFYKFKLTNHSLWLSFLLWFVLFFIAAFRADGVDNDYLNYLRAIQGDGEFTEPSFSIISYVCYDLFDSTKLVFVTYAFLSVSLLLVGLKDLSPYFFLSLAVYYSTSYVIHDLNQIRAGVGVGFMFLALKYWINGRMSMTLILISLATFFHISFLMFFFFYFIIKDDKKYLSFYFLLIPIAYLTFFLSVDALSILLKIPIPQVQNLALAYSEWNIDLVSSVNVFSTIVIIKLIILIIIWIFRDDLGKQYQGFYLYFKMYSTGLFMLIFLAALPGAAFRTADLFWVSECLLIPMFLNLVRPRWVVTLLILSFCLIMVWLNYVHSNFVRPYDFNFDL